MPKRKNRRPRRKAKIPRSIKQMKTLGIKRKSIIESPDFSVTETGQLYAPEFRLSDLPEFAEFTALFQQYKLNAVKLQFIPVTNITDTQATGGKSQIYIHSVFDPVNELSIHNATEDKFLQYNNCKTRPLIKSNQAASYYYAKVNPLLEVKDEAGTSAPLAQNVRRNRSRLTCSTEGAEIPHLGLKMWIQNTTGDFLADAGLTFKVIATYYATFYGVN